MLNTLLPSSQGGGWTYTHVHADVVPITLLFCFYSKSNLFLATPILFRFYQGCIFQNYTISDLWLQINVESVLARYMYMQASFFLACNLLCPCSLIKTSDRVSTNRKIELVTEAAIERHAEIDAPLLCQLASNQPANQSKPSLAACPCI